MEDLVRVHNEYDRQVLAWLRVRVGDAALQSAAHQAATDGEKPYLSTICRSLGLRPPSRGTFREEAARTHRAVGERYLARIRQILGADQPEADGATAASHRPARPFSRPFQRPFPRPASRLQGSLF
ncbi:hypothetical protein [Cupriavidus plantarum]|uniref:hypothetical protein n=1 Tax=Cupriavidus plantarum TaxID=942865 RepID=UPI001B2C5495|nr:hypothetical protein [Cupriavidus plantarum]CAG2128271.1 hypothetical protein LMG26296_01320 [Cupriavidus plantarum]SMR66548.1 hypothetical protein SAMN05421735_1432 [Cupriavidus plantarum]